MNIKGGLVSEGKGSEHPIKMFTVSYEEVASF